MTEVIAFFSLVFAAMYAVSLAMENRNLKKLLLSARTVADEEAKLANTLRILLGAARSRNRTLLRDVTYHKSRATEVAPYIEKFIIEQGKVSALSMRLDFAVGHLGQCLPFLPQELRVVVAAFLEEGETAEGYLKRVLR